MQRRRAPSHRAAYDIEAGLTLRASSMWNPNFFIILAGELEVVQPGHGGVELPIVIHGPGQYTIHIDDARSVRPASMSYAAR